MRARRRPLQQDKWLETKRFQLLVENKIRLRLIITNCE